MVSAWAVCLESFLCLGCCTFLLVSANAGGRQLGCWAATSAGPPSKAGIDIVYKTKLVLDWVSQDVGLGLPPPRVDSKPQPSWLGVG